MALNLTKTAAAGVQSKVLLEDDNVEVLLGFMAGQQPGSFNLPVEPENYDIKVGELLRDGLMTWNKARSPVIQSLDELSRESIEVYLNTHPVTDKTLKTIFAEPQKYELTACQQTDHRDRTVYQLGMICLVPQKGGGGFGEEKR